VSDQASSVLRRFKTGPGPIQLAFTFALTLKNVFNSVSYCRHVLSHQTAILKLHFQNYLYFQNMYMVLFGFVDFILIFNLSMLKFYFFFCLFICGLNYLLKCFLYFGLYSNYCVISKFCFYVIYFDVNFFLGIRQKFHLRLFNKNISSC
jgi:hypothetical protein